jgi:hypothetical protein
VNQREEHQARGNGSEYRPRIEVQIVGSILKPRLRIKHSWPRLLIEAALITAAIAGMLMVK